MLRSSRSFVAVVVMALVATVVAGGAQAQTDEIEQLRAERDQVREGRARAAADLDPLFAANDEIEEALATLNDDLAGRQAALATTRSQLDKARADVVTSQERIVAAQAEIAALRVELQEQALTVYMRPGSDNGEEALESENINDGERRRALLRAVSRNRNDIIDAMRGAEAELEIAAARAEQAQANIETRQATEARQLGEVEQAISRQQGLQDLLTNRIAEFQAEVDGHAAEEDEITALMTGLIADENRRLEAIREAARIEEERQRVAEEEARIEAARLADIAAGRTSDAPAGVDRAEAALNSAPTVAVSQLLIPTSGPVTSEFGPRWGRLHKGIDISANTGSPVLAAASGVVITASSQGNFGNLVLIDHGGGLVTAYAHLNSFNVSQGQSVSVGNTVGTVGCTGSCTGPHLHFETRVNGVAYDPRSYFG